MTSSRSTICESYSGLLFFEVTGTTRCPFWPCTTTPGATLPSPVLTGCTPVAKSCATPSSMVGSRLSGSAVLPARDLVPDRRRLSGRRRPLSLAYGGWSAASPDGWPPSPCGGGGAGLDSRRRRIEDCVRGPRGRKKTVRARLGGGCSPRGVLGAEVVCDGDGDRRWLEVGRLEVPVEGGGGANEFGFAALLAPAAADEEPAVIPASKYGFESEFIWETE